MARVDEKEVVTARRLLESALPKDHPVQDLVDETLVRMWDELGGSDVARQAIQAAEREAADVVACYAQLLDVLEDWRRGIRDWSEVEDALADVGLARESRTETEQKK
jgi:hypothetical protein